MCWVGGWHLLCLVLLQGHAGGAGVIPNKAARGMPESPLDPPSRFWFRRDWPRALHAGSFANEVTHQDLPPQGQTVLLAMVADGLQCDGWTAKTFLTYETQLVMHCPQVVDNSTFILNLIPTPGAVGQPVEVA